MTLKQVKTAVWNTLKEELKFKAKRYINLIIDNDFCLEKSNLTCCWENFLDVDKRVVPNKAMLEGKIPENLLVCSTGKRKFRVDFT